MVAAEYMLAAATASPLCRYDVVREPGWPVTLLGVDEENLTETARTKAGATARSTVSDTASTPAGNEAAPRRRGAAYTCRWMF